MKILNKCLFKTIETVHFDNVELFHFDNVKTIIHSKYHITETMMLVFLGPAVRFSD